MIQTKYISLIFTALSLLLLGSCKINKGFEALDSYNYFEAKKYLEKSLKKNESPAAFGLSKIYFRTDNPFHNLDSAYHYSLLSVESYKESKIKKQEKWKKSLDFSLDKAKLQRKQISDLAFKSAVTENSVVSYQYFIAKYPWSKFQEVAEKRRDSLAFLEVEENQSSKALEEYLNKYENSAYRHKARSLLFLAQYEETVKSGNSRSYVLFINKFPDNPLVRDAHYQIYLIETKNGTVADYRSFIRRFPSNPFVEDAWTNLYRLSIADYRKETIEKFAKDYPDFPFQHLIAQDLKLVGKQLFHYAENGKYGFMDEKGGRVIDPIFEYAGQFNNGLAVVIENGLYGYINKDGEHLIEAKFEEAMDFDQGRAIIVENDKYGLIDVSGAYILAPDYLDIGEFSDGIAYVQNEEGYQYYTLEGTLAFSAVFDEAFSFEKGIAKVRKGDEKGFIGLDGAFIVSTTNGSLNHFKDSIFIHELRDSMNFMYASGAYVFEEGFDKIGALNSNRAIVEKDGLFGFVNGQAKVVIPIEHTPYPNYMQFSQFKKGHVILQRLNKYAMIDSLGKSVLPAIFNGIGSYGELIPVSKGQGWGYSSKDVRLKIEYQYEYAFGFENGNAIVEKNDLTGLIDLKNEVIVPIVYESIKRISNTTLLVKKDGLYGLLSTSNATILAAEYERILEISPHFFQLIKNKEITYFDMTNNRIISLRE
ncbi:WG repeat-containing protein [Brumimicrobium oceani]|uniref:WG repeat-containing protein n=1 Tax=Brumimicrobium oceani TaxID=2100725 RepID=A0A2U2XG87_9FLAO|nr:WG repeat-containing protein [Brumimicrobium oceani]PWH86818.1 hypothetical protein DIT68_00720 [Brumimicrobium oceani]